jgi:hypothetical protein
VHIVMPQGQYIPRFEIHAADKAVAPQVTAPGSAAPSQEASPGGSPFVNLRSVWWIGAGVLAVLAGAAAPLINRRQPEVPLAPASRVVAATSGDTVRILVGLTEGTFVDGFGGFIAKVGSSVRIGERRCLTGLGVRWRCQTVWR